MKKILLVLFGLALASSAYAFVPAYELEGKARSGHGTKDNAVNTLEISKQGDKGLAAETTDRAKDMMKDAGETGHGGAWTRSSSGGTSNGTAK